MLLLSLNMHLLSLMFFHKIDIKFTTKTKFICYLRTRYMILYLTLSQTFFAEG